MVLLGKIMILQGVGHPISCLGVCYANDPQKGGYMTPAPALDLTTSLRGDFHSSVCTWSLSSSMSGTVSTLLVGALDLQMKDAGLDLLFTFLYLPCSGQPEGKCFFHAQTKKTNANRNPMKTLINFKIVICKSAASQVSGEQCTGLRQYCPNPAAGVHPVVDIFNKGHWNGVTSRRFGCRGRGKHVSVERQLPPSGNVVPPHVNSMQPQGGPIHTRDV